MHCSPFAHGSFAVLQIGASLPPEHEVSHETVLVNPAFLTQQIPPLQVAFERHEYTTPWHVPFVAMHVADPPPCPCPCSRQQLGLLLVHVVAPQTVPVGGVVVVPVSFVPSPASTTMTGSEASCREEGPRSRHG